MNYSMELPSLFSSAQPDSVRKLFIAILVTESSVQASLWEVVDGSIVVLEHSDTQQYTDLQDLVKKTDQCLQDLGKDSESVDEVIFGLEPEWVDKDGIVDDRKPLLKKITDDLSLKAVGFVVTVEALLHHLVQIPEMQSVILMRFDQSEIHVSVIKQGKILGTKKVGKSGDTAADLTEALARFDDVKGTALPLKVLLFSTTLSDEELNKEEQSLIDHDWVKAKTFVQPPLFELLPLNLLIDVVSREGGKAVAQSLGLLPPGSSKGKATPEGYDNLKEVDAEVAAAAVLPTSFGIPIKDIPEAPDSLQPDTAVGGDEHISGIDDAKDDTPPEDDDETALPTKKSPLATVKKKIKKFFSSKDGKGSHKKHIIIGFAGGLLALILLAYAYMFLTAQAQVNIGLKNTTLSQEARLTLDPNVSSADVSAMVLPARLVTQEVTGNDSAVTTGTKLVGDPAKGTVTMFNKTTSPKTFDAGTELTTGQLKFTLNGPVTVASASVSVDNSNASETKTFGKADVEVTAAAIGPEGNVAKEQNFTVANFDSSTYSASNPQPFTGGASREVRVVSAEDRQKLLTQLRAKLVSDSQAKFKETAGPGMSVVPTGKLTVKSEQFNAKVGDEVNQLTLTLTGMAEGLEYHNQDLQPISEAILSSQVPAGYELVPDELQVLSSPEPVSSASARVTLTANLSSKARPIVNADELKNSIAGKSLSAAEQLLKSNPAIQSIEFVFQPSIAQRLLGRVPPVGRVEITFE